MESLQDIRNESKPFTPFQIIIYGFMGVILSGALLLMLPFASSGQGGASFADSLFTAVSAVCVTGLVVQDTATYWSPFGQIVIIVLIQIGGMGVITAASAIFLASGRRIGLSQRSTMQEAIAAPRVGGIVRLTSFILKTTAAVELVGAAVMAPVFCAEFGPARGLWYAVFHSISAFCNAGFDLMGVKSHYSSLVDYSADPVINIAVMSLIIIGGIGFLTWDDIREHGRRLSRYRVQSKIILAAAAFLILAPAVFFYAFEFSSPTWSGMSVRERALASLFQSVTPRTAGFNTIDLTALSEQSKAVTTALMLIGGSTCSSDGLMLFY